MRGKAVASLWTLRESRERQGSNFRPIMLKEVHYKWPMKGKNSLFYKSYTDDFSLRAGPGVSLLLAHEDKRWNQPEEYKDHGSSPF